ncbi:uncharacterized protein LOC120896831 [Anopheles arabiensis]|uniref:AGAP002637-PA n=3 Tax=gambiae species complex TaxID=44542 RepID=Q2EPZ4_ANOGA|nr:uncharacterized protein LOC5667415 [Anopheles gambiae]XP_040157230.1 uncharacterized protein LOC120896831 [Anopheles arabiensis]ABD18608.1 putative secreted peptide [Anopheles gambiae]EDO64223.1 AGAP002637-PA [Anopheles gambiae str. PEST]
MRTSIERVCILLVLLALATRMTTAAPQCDPIYEEFTDDGCDDNCQGSCIPMKDFCACRIGYKRDLTSGKCIAADQCTPVPESITLSCLG